MLISENYKHTQICLTYIITIKYALVPLSLPR